MQINTVKEMREYVKNNRGEADIEDVIDAVFNFVDEIIEHFLAFIRDGFTPETVSRGVMQFLAAVFVAYKDDLSRMFGRTVGKVAETLHLVFLYFGNRAVVARVN